MVLDIHPEPQNSGVEVWLDGHVMTVGHLTETKTTNNVLAARRTRALAIEQGLFVKEREVAFDFLYVFASFDEWNEHLRTKNWGDRAQDQPLIERVGHMLHHQKGKVVMRERIHAARLRRLKPMRNHP